MDNYIAINGKNYALDLEKFIEFCSGEQNVVSSITQTYGLNEDSNMVLVNKEVGESKESVNEVMSSYRYNTLTNVLNLLLVPISDGTGSIILTEDTNNMHFGQKLAFNTMLEMGIIYEIDLED